VAYVNPLVTLLLWRGKTTDSTKAVPFPLCVAVNSAGSNKTYARLRVKRPIFLFDFNQIQIFLTDFYESPKYQIAQKSDEWEMS
jgi:hypothetical protein